MEDIEQDLGELDSKFVYQFPMPQDLTQLTSIEFFVYSWFGFVHKGW